MHFIKKTGIPLAIALVVAYFLLAPGVWWDDALNGYIQGVIGKYSSSSPVFLAFLCSITKHIYPGSWLLFMLSILLYFSGFALMVFSTIQHRGLALFLFFTLSFWPPLLAAVGVIQTDTIQLAVLSLFVPLTIFFRNQVKYRKLLFAILVILLCVFSLVRHDTLPLVALLGYWMVYSFWPRHGIKPVLTTGLLLVCFQFTGYMLDVTLKFNRDCKDEMRNAVLIADLAAISADSKINYIPDYCWQPYILPKDRTVVKIIFGQKNWKDSFFSYLFNIDPSVGLFTFNTTQHSSDLLLRWMQTVVTHPVLYSKYHTKAFAYFLLGNNFNLSIYDGLRIAHSTNAKLRIEKTEAVKFFLKKHGQRFTHIDGNLILFKDDYPITAAEEQDLLLLVEPKRYSDIKWMMWYAQVPAKVYNSNNAITQNWVAPFFDFFKEKCKWFSCHFTYFLLTISLAFFYRKIKNPYTQFTFLILLAAGFINLSLKFLLITDPVFRFGLCSILLSFFALIIFIADGVLDKYYRVASIAITCLAQKIGTKNNFLLGFSLLIGLIIAEVLLRTVGGIMPGRHNYGGGLIQVDTLITLKGLYADSEGILKVSPQTKVEFDERIASMDLSSLTPLYDSKTESPIIYGALDDMREVLTGKVENEFAAKFKQVANSNSAQTDYWDSALINYVHHPVNRDGFFSIPFSSQKTKRKKILLLGDSFTMGHSLQNITSSFANILLSRGYEVYNTGITTADVPQYLAIARKYIPIIKPDMVIVNFFMGNDIQYFPRPLEPLQPLVYLTNAGYLYGYPQGVRVGGAQETYRFAMDENSIPSYGYTNKFCSLSAVGTVIWRFFEHLHIFHNVHPEHDAYWQKVKSIRSNVPFCNAELQSIINIAEANGSVCVISVIRDVRDENKYDPALVPHLFENMPYVISPVKKEGYILPDDGHYSETGHKEYALFLDSIIRTIPNR